MDSIKILRYKKFKITKKILKIQHKIRSCSRNFNNNNNNNNVKQKITAEQ